MSYKKLMLAAACAITASCSGMTAALADVTVRMLHVEQSPQVAGFWNDIRA
jgi:phage protein D